VLLLLRLQRKDSYLKFTATLSAGEFLEGQLVRDQFNHRSLVNFSIGDKTIQPPAGRCRSLIIGMQPKKGAKRLRGVLKLTYGRLRLRHQQFDLRLGTVRVTQRALRLL
jgi:hypothetical protein